MIIDRECYKLEPLCLEKQMHAKYRYESKHQLLISKREGADLKHYNDFKMFIEYSNDMDDIYKNIGEDNPSEECKILFVFDDVIADKLRNKNFSK